MADKPQLLKGLFPRLAVVSGALSWARRAGLAATSIFGVMPLRSRQQESLNMELFVNAPLEPLLEHGGSVCRVQPSPGGVEGCPCYRNIHNLGVRGNAGT